MGKNGNNDEGVIELWGHTFNSENAGSYETQVVSFVNELISQQDMLIQREEHIS